MIIPIRSTSGRLIHVVPDHEPVFTYSEVIEMTLAGYGPEQTEFVALVKEIFPTAGDITFPDIPHTAKEQMTMAFLGQFNTEEVADSQDFSPIPAGDYPAVIIGSEMVDNAARTGSFLKLEFSIIGDNYANRRLFARLNLDNPNATAVDIARSELKAITVACGKKVIQDSEELHNIPLTIKVKTEKRKDNGEDTNVIKGYVAQGVTKAVTAPRAATPAATSKPAGATPPWQRKAA
jgi:hypothetical protein